MASSSEFYSSFFLKYWFSVTNELYIFKGEKEENNVNNNKSEHGAITHTKREKCFFLVHQPCCISSHKTSGRKPQTVPNGSVYASRSYYCCFGFVLSCSKGKTTYLDCFTAAKNFSSVPYTAHLEKRKRKKKSRQHRKQISLHNLIVGRGIPPPPPTLCSSDRIKILFKHPS